MFTASSGVPLPPMIARMLASGKGAAEQVEGANVGVEEAAEAAVAAEPATSQPASSSVTITTDVADPSSAPPTEEGESVKKKPRGRPPKGKDWDTALGKWVDKPEEEEAPVAA